MTEQYCRSFGIPLQQFLAALHEAESDYRPVLSAPTPEFQYELIVRPLARLLAVAVPDWVNLQFPLIPVFPERDTRPPAAPRQTPCPPKQRCAFF